MPEKIQISEKDNIHQEWFSEAKKCTLETLPEFLRKLIEDYHHDYGTICHALSAGAIATAWAMDQSPMGGITGFQAGAVMWSFIKNWTYTSNKTGLKMINYDDMLYPQYAHKFNKLISPATWKALKKEAKEQLEKADAEYSKYLADCEQYEKDLADFILRHPDYSSNPETYVKIHYGTSLEWQEQEAKEKAGFDFAPDKPFNMLGKNSPVYRHWKSITEGEVPFGYKIGEE